MNELNRLLGSLESSMRDVKDDLKVIREEMKESERASSQSRRGMHQRLDEVVKRTGDLERDLDEMTKTVSDVKAVTDKVTMWENRGIGALAMAGFAASSLTFLLTHYWEQIVRYFSKV